MSRGRKNLWQAPAQSLTAAFCVVAGAVLALFVTFAAAPELYAQENVYGIEGPGGSVLYYELRPNGHRLLTHDETVLLLNGGWGDDAERDARLQELREERARTPHPNYASEESTNSATGNPNSPSHRSGGSDDVVHLPSREHTAAIEAAQRRSAQRAQGAAAATTALEEPPASDAPGTEMEAEEAAARAEDNLADRQVTIVRRSDGSYGPAPMIADTQAPAAAENLPALQDERLPQTDMLLRRERLAQANQEAAEQRAEWSRRRAVVAAREPVAAALQAAALSAAQQTEQSRTTLRDLLPLVGFGSLLGIGFGVFVPPRFR